MQVLTQSPTDPAFVADPYPFYDRARAAGPFVRWADFDGLICTTTFAATNAVLRDRRMGRARLPEDDTPAPPHLAPFDAVERLSLLSLEPPAHTRLRGLVLRAFTSRRIAALAPEVEGLAHSLIDGFAGSSVDLLPAYCQRIPVIVIARLLGVPEAMADDLLAWSNAMVAIYQARRDRGVEDAAARAAAEFSVFLRGYVEERRSRPADDLITHLIAAEEAGERLTTDELIATCILLLNAGHEATVHSMGNGVRALLTHGMGRDVMTGGRAEGTVEEILRWDPPLHLFTRTVYEEVEVAGQRFARGDRIGCLLAAAGRDPGEWPDPARFDPARPVRPNLALGAGLHFCVGAPLARLELAIGLRVLFDRLPHLRLAGEPAYGNVYHFHGLTALRVTA
ncbi:MAG: cytochrome P450 [Rhodobacteraceae bacterium]|jgi:cytochrome P450|nr:cytochrome P450 [Paracoccaceae bacterium]